MQFSVIALLSLVAVAFASPIALPDRLDDIVARQTTATSSGVDAEAPAMSDADGNVVSFNTASVYLDATAKGN
ncbi:uncharacterized protein LY89DRAFT_739746 [Mollisia scopiformis]|uniref:Uncharacterized protein n=1 Tax=Mollisia scopiformis TaxID=149040 RepID=A0A194WS04_MOLSC|nr:uncharacterized protein LY89DRAFT_739746 [Mollisia scopiformis]KUJ10753.1 hypothetical protein LY89DRAFT_739746 [Mollisia scopiformis]